MVGFAIEVWFLKIEIGGIILPRLLKENFMYVKKEEFNNARVSGQ